MLAFISKYFRSLAIFVGEVRRGEGSKFIESRHFLFFISYVPNRINCFLCDEKILSLGPSKKKDCRVRSKKTPRELESRSIANKSSSTDYSRSWLTRGDRAYTDG